MHFWSSCADKNPLNGVPLSVARANKEAGVLETLNGPAAWPSSRHLWFRLGQELRTSLKQALSAAAREVRGHVANLAAEAGRFDVTT